MTPNTKYYFSQIVAVPAVGLPSLLGGFLLGSLIARLTGDSGPVGVIVICGSAMYAISKLTSFGTGWLLERLRLLPRGAWRVYPDATSWEDYLKKSPWAARTPHFRMPPDQQEWYEQAARRQRMRLGCHWRRWFRTYP